jgi:hypothetical protein
MPRLYYVDLFMKEAQWLLKGVLLLIAYLITLKFNV